MCGLPTETDEDVLQIAELATNVIKAGREAAGTRDIRCTVSIGGFVPKPHTPFQWAAQLDHETTDRRLHALRDEIRKDRNYAKAIGFRYHDGRPGIVEGLLSRGDRRVGRGHRGGLARRRPVRRLERALLVRALDGGRGSGRWPQSRWTSTGSRSASGSRTRSCPGTTSTPVWTATGCGRTGRTHWPVVRCEDCRWTPCFDCGVCDHLGTEIQVGPTEAVLMPLPQVRSVVEA